MDKTMSSQIACNYAADDDNAKIQPINLHGWRLRPSAPKEAARLLAKTRFASKAKLGRMRPPMKQVVIKYNMWQPESEGCTLNDVQT